MKRENLLMLLAGVVLGAVLAFIATRQYYVAKGPASPGAEPPHAAAGKNDAAPPGFDPAQHEAMIAKIQADIEKNPEDVGKLTMLANIYYDAGKFTKAIPLYESAMKVAPKDTDVLVDLGVCYRNTGRADDALAMFNNALAVDPDKKQALFNRVVVLAFDKKEPARAKKLLVDLQARFPKDPLVKRLAEEMNKKQ